MIPVTAALDLLPDYFPITKERGLWEAGIAPIESSDPINFKAFRPIEEMPSGEWILMRRNQRSKSLLFCLSLIGLWASLGPLRFLDLPECRAAGFLMPRESISFDSESTWEQQLLAITNQHRIRQGLPPLILDEALMRVAREHSFDMALQGFISHDLPSGNLQTRLNRAGYLYDVARENVASSRTVFRAHGALLRSPAHKSNIIAEDVTHIGIGVVRYPYPCDQYLYVTEVFATPREEYRPSMVQDQLENRVQALRQQGGGAMDPDPLLDQIASRSLLSLSNPYDRTELRSLLAASANELRENGKSDLSRLEVNVQLVRNPKNLNIPASNREGQAQTYGAAVRQITDNRNQPAFLVLTLIGVTR